MKNLLEYIFLFPLRMFVLALPFRGVQKVGKMFGSFVFHSVKFRRELVLTNLRYAFPEKTDSERQEIALKCYQNIFATFFETFWIARLTEQKVHELISMPDATKIGEMLERKKGLIVLSGHITNWELIALSIGVIGKHPLQIIVKKQHNPFVDTVMNSLRTKFNNTVVDMDKSPREFIKRIRDNGVVAMLADQSGPEEGLFVNYFGRPTSTHLGPAIFCLRTGAPILMVDAVRCEDGTFSVEFEEVPTHDLEGSDDDKIRTITERHVALLEKFVRRHPDQWLWMHKRWKHTEQYLKRKAKTVVS